MFGNPPHTPPIKIIGGILLSSVTIIVLVFLFDNAMDYQRDFLALMRFLCLTAFVTMGYAAWEQARLRQ